MEEAYKEMLRLMRAFNAAAEEVQEAVGRGVMVGLSDLWHYAVDITHVDTGALRSSHRVTMDRVTSREAVGRLHLVHVRNPDSGKSTLLYGPIEHDRGGSHAFYERTWRERGEAAVERAAEVVGRRVIARFFMEVS